MAPWSSRGSAEEACPLGGLLISQEFDFCALYVKSPINYAVRARTTKVTYVYYLLVCAQGTVYFKQTMLQEKVSITTRASSLLLLGLVGSPPRKGAKSGERGEKQGCTCTGLGPASSSAVPILSELYGRPHLSAQPQLLLSCRRWKKFLVMKTSCQADWHFPLAVSKSAR